MNLRPLFRVAGCVAVAAALSACSYAPRIVSEYRIDVQQGNLLSQEAVAQLRPGLTKDQVRFILGTPLLMDMFHADRWDYVYRLEHGKTRKVEGRKLTVFFDAEGKLSRVEGDVVPEGDGSAVEATASSPRSKVIDLGEVPEGTAMPPAEEKGWWRRTLERVGL